MLSATRGKRESSRESASMTASSAPLARVSEIAPGTTRRVVAGADALLLCNVDGTLYAIEDACTHDGGELDQGVLEGCKIECPRHGAYFDVTTGAALTMPAILPVRTFALRIDGDDIFLA
jgi:3-phenylpropionate/trans-cinnamate dioxygenase ferredoxin subunit